MVVELLKELVSIPSVSGEEEEVMDFLQNRLERKGFQVERLGNNIIFSLGEGEELMVFNSHLDTVEPSNWERPPFKPKEENGKIYGLGASDNKGSAAAMVKAAEKLDKEKLEKEVVFTFTEMEEKDGSGMKKVLNHIMENKKFESISGIVGEPTDLSKVLEDCKGTAWLKLEVSAEGGHASKDLENPIEKVYQIWNAYREKLEGNGPPSPKIELTGVSAGDSINKIPSKAEARFDVRTVPGFSSEDAMKTMESILEKTETDGEVEFAEEACPPSNSSGSEIVRFAEKILNSERTEFAAAANDACFFTSNGFTAAVLGPGQGDTVHSPGEYIEKKKLREGVEVYRKIAERW